MAAYAQTTPTQSTTPSRDAPVSAPSSAPGERMVSTGDFNVSGDLTASPLIGTQVCNANKESIGKIDDVYLDKDAKVSVVVISVGGFLGVGSKDVAIKWSDLTLGQEDRSLVVTTSLSKDAPASLRDYTKAERRKPARLQRSRGSAPPALMGRRPFRFHAPGRTRLLMGRQNSRIAFSRLVWLGDPRFKPAMVAEVVRG